MIVKIELDHLQTPYYVNITHVTACYTQDGNVIAHLTTGEIKLPLPAAQPLLDALDAEAAKANP
jgi:hypothetical protein